jgi:hypothetical protein
MTNAEKQLQLGLRVVGAIFVVGLFPLTILWPDGFMWEPRQPEYEQMILLTIAVLGVFLFLAAREPAKHRLFIWFAIWQSLAHGLIMAVQVGLDPAERANLMGDVPALLIVAGVLWVLTKRADAAIAAA